jgi:hypothetical protein
VKTNYLVQLIDISGSKASCMFSNPLFRGVSCLVALILTVAATDMAQAQGGPATVGVEVVEIQSIFETVPLFAEVVTSREGTIASRISGTVDAVRVLEGAVVERVTCSFISTPNCSTSSPDRPRRAWQRPMRGSRSRSRG